MNYYGIKQIISIVGMFLVFIFMLFNFCGAGDYDFSKEANRTNDYFNVDEYLSNIQLQQIIDAAAKRTDEKLFGIETDKMVICPVCGKKMIKRYSNIVLTSNPPQYPWYWWCGCGFTQEGGIERGITQDELYFKEWEELNKEN